MKQKSFAVTITVPVKEFLEEARSAAEEYGATFTGDSQSGQFSHDSVEGTYKVADSTAHITITKKPWYAPWSVVESKVREFFI